MKRLIAHPDERVRASGLLRNADDLAESTIEKVQSSRKRRIFIFLSMVVFSCVVLSFFVDSGREIWREKVQRGAEQFVSALSSELGFVVKTITIVGNNTVAAEVLVDDLGIRVGEPMALADLGGALAKVSKLEWVHAAEVTRRWPSEIVIAVRERRPVALWDSSNGRVLIDQNGYSFGSSYVDDFSDLLMIRGVGAPEAFPALLHILETKSAIKSSIVGAVLVGDRRWNLRIRGDLLVRLPEVGLESTWTKFAEHFEKGYLSSVGAVVADYTLADRLILVLGINSAGKNFDSLVRRGTLKTIRKAEQNQIPHGIELAKPG